MQHYKGNFTRKKQLSKICPSFIMILHILYIKTSKNKQYIYKHNCLILAVMYIVSIFLWSTRQHCCMCGTENNREAVAIELSLWAKTNQQKNNNQKR